MQKDTIEIFHHAVIQHGKFNDRIYLMKLGEASPAALLPQLLKLAQENGYSKIFAKIPASQEQFFVDTGFEVEAGIAKFFRGRETASFLGYYLDEDRRVEKNARELDDIRDLALQYSGRDHQIQPDEKFSFRRCEQKDVEIMAKIYAEVFPTYPFPISSPEYLLETMKTHVGYFCAECDGRLVALSSAEKDVSALNVEMTDFATLPDWRGNGLAVKLLDVMEAAMREKKFKTAYTIARAVSPGMNITFAKMNYSYCGRLINNTNISGNIESMNVWAKPL